MSVPIAFATVVSIWSTTALAIKWSMGGINFWLAVSLRMGLAVMLCAAVYACTRWSFPTDGRARRAYLFSGLSMFIGFAGTYWAAQYLSSGLLAVLWGLMPLVSGVLAAWLLDERFGGFQLAGVLLGLLGLWLVFAASISLGGPALLAVAILVVVIVLHAYCLVIMKRYSAETPAFATLSGGLFVANLLFWICWMIFDGELPQGIPRRALYATLYLAGIGSVVGMGTYVYLLQKVKTSQATLATLLPPVCALALGHWLNREPLTWHALSGAMLIVGGLVLSQRPWLSAAERSA